MIVGNYREATTVDYDYCVIGSGAMGMALAIRLSQSGKKVLLLESGGEEVTVQNQDYCRCEVRGRDHVGSSGGRFRVFGGSTERWGGQAMRFDRADLTPRPGIHAHGWPIGFNELDARYAEAEEFMGVENAPYGQFEDEFNQALATSGSGKASINHFSDFKIHYSAFSHQPRLREVYRERIAASPHLFLWKNAMASALETDGSGKVRSLTVCTDGEIFQITAGHFILAAGGIENARFLLVQRDIIRIRELAELNAIGRFFQDHPGAHVAELRGKGAALIQDLFRLKKTPAINLKGRISWAEKKRIDSSLLAVSGTFLMMRNRSECDLEPTAATRRTGTFSDWALAASSAIRGRIYSPLHYTYLAVSAEDMRNPESKIVLSEEQTDASGTPRAKIEWQVDNKVAKSIRDYVDAIDASFIRQGLGSLRRFSFMDDSDQLTAVLKDNSHHIGSTGMGGSPEDAVVDSDLRVFGFSNLWIVGTSVLPTGSHANPTLTAFALTFRLADRLAISY